MGRGRGIAVYDSSNIYIAGNTDDYMGSLRIYKKSKNLRER